MHQGIRAWLAALAPRPLPMLSSTRAELTELMANSQLSVMQYAAPILHDPGLSVSLLYRVNRDRSAAGRQPLTTMTNAMSHLGRGMLQLQLDRARRFEDLPLSPQQRNGYLRYVAQACHAAGQARDWALLRGTHEPEEMQLAALLQNIAELALWCYGDDAMAQIEYRAYAQKQPWEQAAREVLGCGLRELSAALADSWQLPELSQQALVAEAQGFTLATGVALASRLARLTAHSWYDRNGRACIDAIAAYQGRAPGEVESRLQQTALGLSDTFMHLGYTPPARLLPMLVDEAYVDPAYRLSADSQTKAPDMAAATVPAAQASSRQPAAGSAPAVEQGSPGANGHRLLAAQLARVQQLIDQHVHIQQLIQQVVDSIALLGFERVMFALIVPQRKELLGRFYAQPEHAKPLQQVKILLDKPHLFSRLMEKMQHIRLLEDNRARYWQLVPDPVKLMLGNDRFVAMSVFVGERPVGMMYADKPGAQVSDQEYQQFQALCRLLAKGMVTLIAAKPPAGKN